MTVQRAVEVAGVLLAGVIVQLALTAALTRLWDHRARGIAAADHAVPAGTYRGVVLQGLDWQVAQWGTEMPLGLAPPGVNPDAAGDLELVGRAEHSQPVRPQA